jgi:hypothetical protein
MRIITAILKVREHRKSEKFVEMFNCQLQQQDKTLDITV